MDGERSGFGTQNSARSIVHPKRLVVHEAHFDQTGVHCRVVFQDPAGIPGWHSMAGGMGPDPVEEYGIKTTAAPGGNYSEEEYPGAPNGFALETPQQTRENWKEV